MVEYMNETQPDDIAAGTTETGRPVLSGLRRILFATVILLTTVGCDRATKIVAQHTLRWAPPVSYLNDIVRFEYAENTGAFLSLGSGLSEPVRFLLLGVGVGILLVAMLVYIVRTRSLQLPEVMALSLVAAGGVGNLYDRLVHGYVVDFVSIGVGGLRTGIFNVADVAITTGILLFLFLRIRASRPPAVVPREDGT